MVAAAQSSTATSMFRACSDSTRLRILEMLRGEASGELCVCHIVGRLRAPQPTVSRHLAYLRRAGLVDTRRDGLWMHYRLSPPKNAFHRQLLECIARCDNGVARRPSKARNGRRLTILNGGRCC